MTVTDIWGVLHEITGGNAVGAEPGNIAPLDRARWLMQRCCSATRT